MSRDASAISTRSRVVRYGIALVVFHFFAIQLAVELHTVSTERLAATLGITLIVALAVGELGMLTQMKRANITWPWERSGPVRWRDLGLLGTVFAWGISGGSPGLVISGREWIAPLFGGAITVGVYVLMTGIWFWQYTMSSNADKHNGSTEGPDEVDQP